MKKNKVLILLLAVVMIVGAVLTSCTTSADEISVTLIIKAGEEELLNTEMKLSYKDPTVLMLVSEAAAQYELKVTYNDVNDSVRDINDYKDHKDENGIDYFWEYMLNGELPDSITGGKAKDQIIKDGDVVEYVYSSIDPSAIKK